MVNPVHPDTGIITNPVHPDTGIILAEEYDAAQDRGEVARSGQRNDLVSHGNEVKPTAADLGLSRKDIHEARQMRDAERQTPQRVHPAGNAPVRCTCVERALPTAIVFMVFSMAAGGRPRFSALLSA